MCAEILPAFLVDLFDHPFHGIRSAEIKDALPDLTGADMAAFPVKLSAGPFGKEIFFLTDLYQFIRRFISSPFCLGKGLLKNHIGTSFLCYQLFQLYH